MEHHDGKSWAGRDSNPRRSEPGNASERFVRLVSRTSVAERALTERGGDYDRSNVATGIPVGPPPGTKFSPVPREKRPRIYGLGLSLVQKLERGTKRGGSNECWPWMGTRNNGYGLVSHDSERFSTHRLALEGALGRHLRPGEWACHHCDNPPCVNPAHLYVGSAADNARDRVERERQADSLPAEPTARQLEILRFAVNYLREEGSPPSYREIATELQITSTNGVNDHLKAMERKGLVVRSYMKARSLVVTEVGRSWIEASEPGAQARPAMTASVRISHRDAERLLGIIELAENLGVDISPFQQVSIESLRRVLEPKPRSSQAKKTARKNRAKAKTTKEIRAAVMERAGGKCEACGLAWEWNDGPELDHFFPKGRTPQSVETCWAIHTSCHMEKTANEPSAEWWLEKFCEHAAKYGYGNEGSRANNRLVSLQLMRERP